MEAQYRLRDRHDFSVFKDAIKIEQLNFPSICIAMGEFNIETIRTNKPTR